MKRRRLGSVGFVSGATLACVLISGTQLACAKLDLSPDGSLASGGVLTSGGAIGSGGTFASGGALTASSGGASSGGQNAATGGAAIVDPLPPSPCDDPDLDPACNEDDLHGEFLTCKSHTSIRFDFPLTGILPPAEDLRVVFLPLDSNLGAGGMGGSDGLVEAGLDLDEGVPEAEMDGEMFDLVEPWETVGVSYDLADGVPTDYVEMRELSQSRWTFGVAQVALVQGDAILLQYRLFIDRTLICTF